MIRSLAHRTMKGMKTAAKEKMTRLLLATMAWLLALVLWPSFSWAASPDVTTALQPTFDIHAYDVDANKNSKRHYAVGNFFYQVEYWFDGLEGESAQGFTQLIYDSCVRSAERTILANDGSTVRYQSDYGNPYGYTSRRHDEETGLMYFRARYYDPTTGEFIAQDPLEYVDGYSLYRGYFGIAGVDPFGLDWLDNICNFSAGVGDTISFGATRWIRSGWNNDVTDTDSGCYSAGEWTGVAADCVGGGVIVKGIGKQVCKRLGGKTAREAAERAAREAAERVAQRGSGKSR